MENKYDFEQIEFWENEEWLNNAEGVPKEWGFWSSEEEGRLFFESSDFETDLSDYKGRPPSFYICPKKAWVYFT